MINPLDTPYSSNTILLKYSLYFIRTTINSSFSCKNFGAAADDIPVKLAAHYFQYPLYLVDKDWHNIH